MLGNHCHDHSKAEKDFFMLLMMRDKNSNDGIFILGWDLHAFSRKCSLVENDNKVLVKCKCF